MDIRKEPDNTIITIFTERSPDMDEFRLVIGQNKLEFTSETFSREYVEEKLTENPDWLISFKYALRLEGRAAGVDEPWVVV